MTLVHSPWPLFSDDLEFAQNWMRDQLIRFPMTGEAGHTALNIGLRKELSTYLASQPKDNLAKQSRNDQFRFRLARLNGARNPYRELIPSRYHKNACRFVAEAAISKGPLAVQLFGGLGDQLEMLSLVLPWGARHGVPLRLMADEQRCRLLKPLLPSHATIEPFNPKTCPPFAQTMAIRLGMLEHDPNSPYEAWIGTEEPNTDPDQFLCCWRAKGQGSLLSAHSRSVPFQLVYSFYQQLIERQPKAKIVDITAWHTWEERQFQKLGIDLQNPATLGLTGLIQLCLERRVISIDTALIHLCAALGHAADLLLPRFPDERWIELRQPQHSYGQYLTFHRSSQFGSWSSLMASLC